MDEILVPNIINLTCLYAWKHVALAVDDAEQGAEDFGEDGRAYAWLPKLRNLEALVRYAVTTWTDSARIVGVHKDCESILVRSDGMHYIVLRGADNEIGYQWILTEGYSRMLADR